MPVPSSDLKKQITFDLVDALDFVSRHTLTFPYATTLAQLTAYADAYLPRLKACTDAGIMGYSIINTRLFQDTPPGAGSDVTDTVTVLLNNDAGGINEIHVPAIDMGLFEPGELHLDQGDPAVSAYLAHVIANFCNDVGVLHTGYQGSLYEKGQQFR